MLTTVLASKYCANLTHNYKQIFRTNVAVYLPGELEALDGVSLGDGLCEGDPGGLRVLVGLLGCALLGVELPGSAAGLERSTWSYRSLSLSSISKSENSSSLPSIMGSSGSS